MSARSSHSRSTAVCTSSPRTAWRPARLAKLGGLFTTVSVGLLVILGALAPSSDAETLEFAIGTATGSQRAQLLIGVAILSTVLLTLGLLALIAAGAWALVRTAERPAA
jgi:uncharacterized membrane protein